MTCTCGAYRTLNHWEHDNRTYVHIAGCRPQPAQQGGEAPLSAVDCPPKATGTTVGNTADCTTSLNRRSE